MDKDDCGGTHIGDWSIVYDRDGRVEEIHGTPPDHELTRAHEQYARQRDPEPDRLAPGEDHWTLLLRLITQYGAERFVAGWRASSTPLVKVDGTGTAEGNELLTAIVVEVTRLQRETGDD